MERENTFPVNYGSKFLDTSLSEIGVKKFKIKTNPTCYSSKQGQEQGEEVHGDAHGAGQGGSKTMGVSDTQVGARQRARTGGGEQTYNRN